MIEKTMKSRIVHKHDIEINWEKAIGFIPKQGEIIIYDIDDNYSYARFKIGDGITRVNELPFVAESITLDVISQVQEELDNKVDKEDNKGLSTNDLTNDLLGKLDSISSGAEVNQNSFSTIEIDSNTSILANSKTDIFRILGGNNISLSTDTSNNSLTISTSSPDTTLSISGATADAKSVGDRIAIIQENLNEKASTDTVDSLSASFSNFQTNVNTILSNDDAELKTLGQVIDYIKINRESINSKQNTITGAATTITSSNLTANRALISNSSGKVAVSSITNTELGYLSGVTSNIQTQFADLEDSKASVSSLNSYIKGLSVSGKTITYTKGNNTTGTITTQDTTYTNGTGLSLSGTTFSLATSGVTANTYGPTDNVTGSNGATISVPQITVDTYGRVTSIVNKTYTSVNTTYSAATTSAQGLMSAADKTKLDGITTSADSVSFTRSLTSGTKIGTLTINGTGTDLYCTSSTSGSYLPLSGGTMTGDLKFTTMTVSEANDNYGIFPHTNNYSIIGSSSKRWWYIYASNINTTSLTVNGSAVQTYSAGTGISISSAGVISCTVSSSSYSAGTGISISGNTISLSPATSSTIGGIKILYSDTKPTGATNMIWLKPA